MIYLIILDFFWSAAALFVDLPKLGSIHPLLWPVAIICPIYPLLLAIVWIEIKKGKKINSFLLAFAIIPSAIFGILALVYYPSKMIFQGFAFRDLGQIFWVLFYSSQGWYLWFKRKLLLFPVILVTIYLTIKFFLDYRFDSFGYLSFDDFSQSAKFYILLLSLVLVAYFAIFQRKKLR